MRSWPATVAALPLGSRVSGRVIGRPAFGVFFLIDGVPNAVGLAEITAMPKHMELPAMGAPVTGEVIWHADHNHQVKARLHEWHQPSGSAPHAAGRATDEPADGHSRQSTQHTTDLPQQ